MERGYDDEHLCHGLYCRSYLKGTTSVRPSEKISLHELVLEKAIPPSKGKNYLTEPIVDMLDFGLL
jgi:hypothetical protein